MRHPDLPDAVHLMTDDRVLHPVPARTEGVWTARGAEISAGHDASGGLRIRARAGTEGLSRIVLRWRRSNPAGALVLGDAWERSYGDLQWRTLQPDRPLPWYTLISEAAGKRTTGWGVRTRPAAFSSWTVDESGVTLWLDVRSAGLPVLPGDRVLDAATVVTVRADTPYPAQVALCDAMSPDPVRPYCVIDDGWTEGGGSAPGGLWDTGLPGVFDDMAAMAEAIASVGARPGLWFRPLLSRTETSATRPGVRRDSGYPLDPSLDVALETVAADLARFRDWGYELVKHDFSTYDVFGRFAAAGPAELAEPGWSLADRSRTSAEILVRLYRTISESAGDALVIGCNTIGHLAAGLVQIQRTGDDTSGRRWERTRRMGVNTLAFRLAQHNRLFAVDGDCVPCTPATDWSLNRQFLDLVARSGTALFVSVDPAARTERVDADLAAAVRTARDGGAPGGVEPLDWQSTTTPRHWRCADGTISYDWSEPWGRARCRPEVSGCGARTPAPRLGSAEEVPSGAPDRLHRHGRGARGVHWGRDGGATAVRGVDRWPRDLQRDPGGAGALGAVAVRTVQRCDDRTGRWPTPVARPDPGGGGVRRRHLHLRRDSDRPCLGRRGGRDLDRSGRTTGPSLPGRRSGSVGAVAQHRPPAAGGEPRLVHPGEPPGPPAAQRRADPGERRSGTSGVVRGAGSPAAHRGHGRPGRV